MPRLNKEKTEELQKNQEESINKLLTREGFSEENLSLYKQNLEKILEDPGHAKYRIMLKILKSGRAKEQKKEIFVENTASALNSLREDGLSQESLEKIV